MQSSLNGLMTMKFTRSQPNWTPMGEFETTCEAEPSTTIWKNTRMPF